MVELYYEDLIGKNKEGKWGIEKNKLIRLDKEGNELYHYIFKECSVPSFWLEMLNLIIKPLGLKLVDSGSLLPISTIGKYKLYYKVVDKYYDVKNKLELERNMNAIREMTERKIKVKKKSQVINNNGKVKQQVNISNGNGSFAFGHNTKSIGSSSMTKSKRDRILELIRKNEQRVKYGR